MQAARVRQYFQAIQGVLTGLGAADEDALKAQQRLGDGPAIVLLPDQRADRNMHTVQEHFAELSIAGDILDRTDGDAGHGKIYQHEADAGLGFGMHIGAHQAEHMAGVLRERGPDLLAGDHILIAFANSARAQGREIRAGIRFGIALAPDLFTRQGARQVIGLLLCGAVTHQHRA